MKKKGRICGTIGLILSLALAGGTVVYGTMFYGKAVGKAEKPFGASTGNVFEGWIKKTGFDQTKKLVDESSGVFEGTSAEYEYKSYSASYNMTLTAKTENWANYRDEGTIYTDESYTYLKGVVYSMAGRRTTVEAYEYVLVKESGAWYARTNTSPYTESGDDALLLDKAKWAVSDGPEFMYFDAFSAAFDAATELCITPFGEQYFTLEEEGVETECRFTVGTCPTLRLATSVAEDEASYESTVAIGYFNLNNTEVSLPESLKEVI